MQNALVAENGRQRGLYTQTETGGKEENEISREIEKQRNGGARSAPASLTLSISIYCVNMCVLFCLAFCIVVVPVCV